MSTTIDAKSLFITSLNQQIIDAGGEGYNCNVHSERVKNSFSVIHTFRTPEGVKVLQTPNEYMVGLIADERRHYVYFHMNEDLYVLYTFEGYSDTNERVHSSKVIGNSFDSMKVELQKLFPKRCVWNLCDPRIALFR